MVGGARREAGKSPLLIGCWFEHRGPLVHDLRTVGVSLWQPISYTEAELLVSELATDPGSHLARAIANAPAPVDPEQAQAADETRDHYHKLYGL